MKRIVDFLKKFSNLKPSGDVVEKESLKIINNIFGNDGNCAKISFKNPNLIITADPFFKSEVFLKKQEIMKQIYQNLNRSDINILFR